MPIDIKPTRPTPANPIDATITPLDRGESVPVSPDRVEAACAVIRDLRDGARARVASGDPSARAGIQAAIAEGRK